MKNNSIIWAFALSTILLTAPAEQKQETAPKTEATAPAETYPLTTCVISGQPLDSMGKPYIHMHEGTEVRFCCKGCLPAFNKDPEAQLKKIKKARAATEQKSDAEKPHDHSGHDHSAH
ncbi:MAG: hypothetical protein PF795_10490 [Kiritimatiellae bacterium]|jgi:hypothetical protein|nr:hypothetical protein [Kiritimatiellia bacterium]